MSSIDSKSQPNDYFILRYFEDVLRNAVALRREVDAHYEQLVPPIQPHLSEDNRKLIDSLQARLKLYAEVFDFFSEQLAKFDKGQSGVSDLNLLSYSTFEADGRSLGTLIKRIYQPTALPKGRSTCERCSCENVKSANCCGSYRVSLPNVSEGYLECSSSRPTPTIEAERNEGGNNVGKSVGCGNIDPVGGRNNEPVGNNEPVDGGDVATQDTELLSICTTGSEDEAKLGRASGLVQESEQIQEPFSLSPPHSLEFRLWILQLEDAPAPWEDLPVSSPEPHPSSLGSLNLLGPGDEIRHRVLMLPREIPVNSFSDAHLHSSGSLVCCPGEDRSIGLWFQSSETMLWQKVIETPTFSICIDQRGDEAFTVSAVEGDTWVKKFDLKSGRPVEEKPLQPGGLLTSLGLSKPGGFFQVSGSKRLSDVAVSPGGRLAVADPLVRRVTIHRHTGDHVCDLKEKFGGGRPFSLSWLTDRKLVVGVWESRHVYRFYCIQIPRGDLVWTSDRIPFVLWMISCWRDRVYVPVLDGRGRPRLFKVLNGDSGEEIKDRQIRCEKGAYPVRVMDVDAGLTVLHCKQGE